MIHLTVAKNWDFGVSSYLQVIYITRRILCIGWYCALLVIVVRSWEMKIHDDSERLLAHIIGWDVEWMFLKGLCMANKTFCYLVSIIAIAKETWWLSYIITIKSIMTMREITRLTCQDFKKRPKSEILAITATCKWYLYYTRRILCIGWYCALLVIVVCCWEMKIHDNSERILKIKWMFLKGLCMTSTTLCYLETIIAINKLVIETWIS